MAQSPPSRAKGIAVSALKWGGAIAFLGLVGMLAMLCIFAVGGLKRSREAGGMACAVVIVFLIYTASYPHMYSRMWMVPVFSALGAIYARREGEVVVSGRDPAAATLPPPASTRHVPQA